MSASNKNIDKLISERLKGHSVKAPEGAWNRLHGSLHKPARVRFFWLSRSVAAAVLLFIAFGAGYYLSELNKSTGEALAENQNPIIENSTSNGDATIDGDVMNADEFAESTPQQTDLIKNTVFDADAFNQNIQSADTDTQSIPTKQIANESQAILAEVDNTPEIPIEDQSIVTAADEIPKEELVATESETIAAHQEIKTTENSEQSREIPKDEIPAMMDEMLRTLLISGDDELANDIIPLNEPYTLSRWSIGGRISPVYSYRNISGEGFQSPDETVDAGYFDSNEKGITTVAGGISLDYRINPRLSLGSGMYLSRIGQQNNEVLAYNDPENSSMYKLTSSTGTVTINPVNFESVIVQQQIDSPKDSLPGDYTVNGSFVQNLDYLEVPLVLKYKVIDKKFSINLMGGVSPGILVNNRSYFDAEGQKIQTGTTENIDPFIYNSIVGLGLQYAVTRKLALSMEPSFKYSLSPVNSGTGINYHPYSISWFTGISYTIE